MQDLKILNSKEIKEIYGLIESQWGSKVKLDYGFLKNQKNRIFVIRMSIEGSQIVGPKAEKNVVELDEEETKKWFKGEDIEKECSDCRGFVILKHGNDFLGSGKYSNKRILNYVSKTRRISAS